MDSTQDSGFCAEAVVSRIVAAVESGVRTDAITIRPDEEES
jgi:hypothetical protein